MQMGGRGKKASSCCMRGNFDGNIGGILKLTLGSMHQGIISRSILKGLHMKGGDFVSNQHLLWDRGKEIKGKLRLVRLSQDLPDPCRLLARVPPFKYADFSLNRHLLKTSVSYSFL
jgi:hypothetical protein